MHELDVNNLPPEDRFAAFAGLIKYWRVAPRSRGPFRVHARFWQLRTMVIAEQWIDAVTFDRTAADVNAYGSDHYSVILLIEGECNFHYGEESRTMGPGG